RNIARRLLVRDAHNVGRPPTWGYASNELGRRNKALRREFNLLCDVIGRPVPPFRSAPVDNFNAA
ncbi:MAG: hypothetical protein AAFZ06_07400, partial [Pseudomonadota bacterium]